MVRAHSTEGGGFRPAARLCAALLLVLVAEAPAFAAPAPVVTVSARLPRPSVQWTQVERRIESGYFQQNASGLEAMVPTLAAPAGRKPSDARDEEWRGYYAGLLAYRLALLAKDDAERAWPFTQRCVDRLNQTLVLDPNSAEALALQSACLALQSHLDPWASPLAGPQSLERIDRALTLAPHNPRVLLLGAEAARDRPRLFGGDDQESFELLERAVGAFEGQGQAQDKGHGARPGELPAWGAADAFTRLAQVYLTRGNAIAARNVLERALLVAPDFTQARRLMAEIVSG